MKREIKEAHKQQACLIYFPPTYHLTYGALKKEQVRLIPRLYQVGKNKIIDEASSCQYSKQ